MPKFTKTPQDLNNISHALTAISKCKPRQFEVVIKITRAQVAIERALEPFEAARKELIKQYPPELGKDPTPEQQIAYQEERNKVDAEFRKMYESNEFVVDLPQPLKTSDIQHFQEMPNPSDLVHLVPMMYDLRDEDPTSPAKTKKK